MMTHEDAAFTNELCHEYIRAENNVLGEFYFCFVKFNKLNMHRTGNNS